MTDVKVGVGDWHLGVRALNVFSVERSTFGVENGTLIQSVLKTEYAALNVER